MVNLRHDKALRLWNRVVRILQVVLIMGGPDVTTPGLKLTSPRRAGWFGCHSIVATPNFNLDSQFLTNQLSLESFCNATRRNSLWARRRAFPRENAKIDRSDILPLK